MAQKILTRPLQIKFYVTETEKEILRRRMAEAGTKRQSDFLRKMALNGMILNVDYSQINDVCDKLGRIGVNINQIAKRVNSTSNIYSDDIAEIKKKQAELFDLLNSMESKLL